MTKRERIRDLKERIRAGGAAHYYDDDSYTGDTISDDDAGTLLTVSDQFDLHDYSDNRHEKLLRHLVRLAEQVGGLTDALEDRDAAEALVRWINREYDNPRTKCDYRLAIRAMGKHALRNGTHGDPPQPLVDPQVCRGFDCPFARSIPRVRPARLQPWRTLQRVHCHD